MRSPALSLASDGGAQVIERPLGSSPAAAALSPGRLGEDEPAAPPLTATVDPPPGEPTTPGGAPFASVASAFAAPIESGPAGLNLGVDIL